MDEAQGPTAPAVVAGDTAAQSADAGPRPDWLPEGLWDKTTGPKRDEINRLLAFAEERASHIVPASRELYELTTPEGSELRGTGIDPHHELVEQFRDFAARERLSQPQFSRLLEFGLKVDQAEQQRIADAVVAEREKLGTRAAARITEVVSWLDGHLGTELAARLHGMLFTAKQVEAFERLMEKNRGAVPGNPGAARNSSTDGDDDAYERLSTVGKITWARDHNPLPST